MLTRSFGANGQFQLTDWTEELMVIPNQWGTIRSLGLFAEEGVTQHSVTFEEITRDGGLLVDRVRGDRNTVNKDDTRKLHAFLVPHFPHDDYIMPSDIQGQRAYGSPDQAETLAAVRMRKLERIRQNHAWTLERARAQILTAGTVYAPNSTVSQNWFTEFGVTQKTVDFVFGTATTDIIAKIEEAIAHIQDNAGNGGVITGVVGLCSPTFFAKLISHATVKAAYQYYTSTQEPLRNRLVAGNNAAGIQRRFVYGGVEFIEMRDSYAGTQLITAGDCVFVPTGTDAFRTYFSPANKFDFVNTIGEQAYVFEYQAPTGDKITLESESNFVNACMRPAVIVRGFSST
jgi:hypothetical protein